MRYILNFKKGAAFMFTLFIWIFDAPDIENEAFCIDLIKKTITRHNF